MSSDLGLSACKAMVAPGVSTVKSRISKSGQFWWRRARSRIGSPRSTQGTASARCSSAQAMRYTSAAHRWTSHRFSNIAKHRHIAHLHSVPAGLSGPHEYSRAVVDPPVLGVYLVFDGLIGLDISDVSLDGSPNRAPCCGKGTGSNPTGCGSDHHGQAGDVGQGVGVSGRGLMARALTPRP